jgi:peptide/nickel transport system substrate-binding protein
LDPEVAKKGGTIYVLTQAEQWNQVDPQRAYTGEDLAFFGGTTMRALTAYKLSADETEGTSLQPDMATDLGTPSEGGKVWTFTLRDGVTWQDGTDVTCDDVKYGVSRTYATDVINQGPTYAVVYLDIPTEADGSSAYKGPYTKVGQDLYDKAVLCDGKTITFKLNKPIADFNYTVTLGFGAVQQSKDTGELFGTVAPFIPSNGPYKVDSYTTGNGGKYVLVRNENWKSDSDFRPAYPDRWEVHFGIDPLVLDQRIMQSAGNDAFAVQYGQIQPQNLGVIFTDPDHTTAEYGARAISGFDPYSRYYLID